MANTTRPLAVAYYRPVLIFSDFRTTRQPAKVFDQSVKESNQKAVVKRRRPRKFHLIQQSMRMHAWCGMCTIQPPVRIHGSKQYDGRQGAVGKAFGYLSFSFRAAGSVLQTQVVCLYMQQTDKYRQIQHQHNTVTVVVCFAVAAP